MKRYSNDETSVLDNLNTCKYSPYMYVHQLLLTHTNLETRTLHMYLPYVSNYSQALLGVYSLCHSQPPRDFPS